MEGKKLKEKRVSYNKKPDNLSLEKWQWELRRQFGEDNDFKIKHLGGHQVFADYNVFNPQTKNYYKVAIRSVKKEINYCDCLDFKTNRLGICKHISAVLKTIKQLTQWENLVKVDYVPLYTSIYLDYKNGRQLKIRIGSENTSEFLKFSQKYFDNENQLKENFYYNFEKILIEAKNINEDFRCYSDALQFVLEKRDAKQRHLLFSKIFNDDPSLNELKNIFNAELFPYQKTGVKFGAIAGRSLIADDMGLGKTIQALAIAELYKKHLGITKVLVVCPTSLKYQWKSEIEKFTNSAVSVIEGQIQKRKEQYLESDSLYFITSYYTLANDVEFLNDNVDIDMVILDEAQRIKNWKTKVSKSVKQLNSQYAAVLTGTPIENKIDELYSIMQFVDVFRLGPMYSFLDTYQIKSENSTKIKGYRNLNSMGLQLNDVIIRRTKKEVLKELPSRSDKNLFVPMTQEQKEIHDDLQTIVSRVVSKWNRQGFLNEVDRQRLLLSLGKMRMVCDSTFILDQQTRHDTKIEELMNILDEYLEDSGNKVVVFSQWERMTRLVGEELSNRGLKYEYLHGGIPSKKRKDLLDNFKNDPLSRVFLSTDAGGVGLNLQSASMVINLDIPWNPAVLEQRIGRVYRLGQKNNVSVINLISTGTIEHKMLNVLKFKSAISGGILDGGEDTIFLDQDKFKNFMQDLKEVTIPFEENTESVSEKEEPRENVKGIAMSPIVGDDDIEEENKLTQSIEKSTLSEELIDEGLAFLSKLMKTLNDPQASKELINAIVDKDEKGKTYLKIPIENIEIVDDGMKLLSGLISNFMKK